VDIRIYRNARAHFYDHGDVRGLETEYSDAWFRNLRDHGFNGFFLNVWLRQFVPFRQAASPAQLQTRDRLARLADRAAACDVGLYLYLNEPHAFAADDPIWERFPGMAGEAEVYPLPRPTPTRMICTSTAIGRAYVYEMAHGLYAALPGLAGSVHINASEFPTHCYCHIITNPGGTIFSGDTEHEGIDCTRCARRRPEEVVAEILNLFRAAADDVGSDARIIAWNWDWVMWAPDPQPRLISRLQPGIALMAGFEAGGSKVIAGVERRIEEYSLISTGPSPQYCSFHEYARQQDVPMLAKLQLSTTHEAATLANLPLLGNVFDKLSWLHRNGVAGFLGCWNFGNLLCLNTAAVGLFMRRPDLRTRRDAFLRTLCSDYLGRDDTETFCRAIDGIERAFDHYPVANRMLHKGPVSFALSAAFDRQPPRDMPLSQNWLDEPRGDRWEECLGPYSLAEVVAGFERLLVDLEPAVELLAAVLFSEVSPWDTSLANYRGEPLIVSRCDQRTAAANAAALAHLLPPGVAEAMPELLTATGFRCLQEWTNLMFMLAMFRSVRNLFANYAAKRSARGPDDALYERLLVSEHAAVGRALTLCHLDDRLGLHLECQAHLVSREKLTRKLQDLQVQLRGARPSTDR
jgi:hypothetical protein